MDDFSISVDQLSVNKFRCPVCLDLLEDPVTIPCGHSFCKVCINGFWDQEDRTGVYSCPQCRHSFNPRPVLHRNIMLEKLMEKVKNSEAQAARWDAGPGDVECNLCSGRKRKAVKSCLMCLASFCETHLKPHYEVPSWKKHKLIEASGKLQEKICSEHHEVLKIYCRTDQSFICYLCTMHEHRGHDTVAAAAERSEKQEDWIGVYSCPKCRHTFNPRPVLHRNIMLEKLMEKVKNSEAQAARYDAGPGDVECNLCSGRKRKAVKSCLMCLNSFCETHLKPHYEVPSWKKHKLIEASGNLQEKTQLKEEQMKFQQRLQEKQKKVQELKQDVNIIKLSAQTAVDDSEKIFTEMISSMEKKRSEVTELIRDQEKAELSGAERLLEQLEQEISDLQRRITELEQLSHTHDHIHFLQSFQSLSVSSGCDISYDDMNFLLLLLFLLVTLFIHVLIG
ncbi:finTRIM family, member 67 [Silurus meridionalis]|nr:finTRIM family, member 67 [Silurus meridionalis]